MKKYSKESGFTLIELLVVIAVIALLTAIVLPFLNGANESGRMAAGKQSDANILHGLGDQLAGEWKFDEGAGTAKDTSSYGEDGTLHNNPVWSATDGYDGKGDYILNGSGQYISANTKSLGNTNNVTFTAWVKGTGSSDGAGIVFYRGGSIAATGIVVYSNQLRAIWASMGMWAQDSGLNLSNNTWNFVAMSVTPTKITLYENGQFHTYSASNYGGTFPTQDFSSTQLQIGADSAYGRYWGGSVDEVRIYSSALTAMDLDNIYADELPAHENLAAK